MRKILSFFIVAFIALNAMAATEMFNPAKAFIPEGGTYFAPNWAQETNSTATYDSITGTITVDLKSQFYGQWQAQVKIKHNVVFNPAKQYTLSVKFKSTVAIGGITAKMDDNVEMIYANQSINLPANQDFVFTSEPANGAEGSNQILVFDFGWAVPCQVKISEISIKEVGDAVAPPEVVHPAAAPAPTHDNSKVFAIYSDAYTSTVTRVTGSWGQTTKEQEVELAAGDKAFYYSNNNYLGWEFNGSTTIGDMTAYPNLHMDIYVAEAGTIGFTPIWGAEAEKKYTLNAGWNALNIVLATDFPAINLTNIFQLKWANMPATCYIDNVYFYTNTTQTGLENIVEQNNITKTMVNGQVVIIRNGATFDLMGREVF